MNKDPVPLKAVHHIEFWVGNAKQAAYFYRRAFGFSQLAYAGLETGNREKASYVLGQGRVRLVFSTPLNGNNGISDHIKQHGDGVKDIAFHVDDAKACYDALEVGAILSEFSFIVTMVILFGIAAIKCWFIGSFFMHMTWDPPLVNRTAAVPIFFLIVLFLAVGLTTPGAVDDWRTLCGF
jgi:4-hydroxyphenylpyruvate dioxygenase-like putative hemolysin